MAKKGNWGFLLAFMVILFSSCTCSGNEFKILLSIKASLEHPSHSLSNWNSSLSYCQWEGIVCNNNMSHVQKIQLSRKNFSGEIPDSIFHFPNIETIDLSSNQFSGEIPTSFSSCYSLKFLNLSNNNLTGHVPKISISGLRTLDLSNNMISGKIPEEIGLLSGLKFLDLGGNVLVGGIPKSISNITHLEFLTLASNQLMGEIPREIGLLKSLKLIYLGYNNFSGEIPREIGELTSLYHLDLVYNNLTGQIPFSLENLSDLKYLFLYFNKLSGSVPMSIFGLKQLISLDLSDNFLSGEIPEAIIQLQDLEILHLFSNNFTGKMPNSLASLPKLRVLQLWSNRFSGEIPKNLGKNQSNFTLLDLSSNTLTGKVPGNLCNSGKLFKLILFSNSLEGEIPRSLDLCMSLKRVRLQNNRLSGELSPGMTKLPLVYFLDISGNNLSGTINGRKWDMPQLQMLNLARNKFVGGLPQSFGTNKLENLDLSENGFSGSIPGSFGSFSELMQFKVSTNNLFGKIPEELSLCKKLVSLDLSHNQFMGSIPNSLSELPVLSQLYLSDNRLTGIIPSNLGKVESLIQVNISHNHFHGNLPATGAFLAINASAVAGNDLCGGDPTTRLPPCKRVKSRVWWFSMTCLGVVLVVISLGVFFIMFVKSRKELELKRVENEYGNWEIQFFHPNVSKSLSLCDILSATTYENVISRNGGKEVSYKGKSTKGMEFIVKETPLLSLEMVELGKLKHPNIVKLVAICKSSEKGGFLVFENIEGPCLSEVLGALSWGHRQRIAFGVAKALRYLHCYNLPGVLVGDLSPESVIVDGKGEPRLSLSLPGVCTDAKCFMSSAYVAPESKETKEITEKSDIYGFGLILIELLTGKSPGDNEFGVHGTIVEWARYCYSDCHLDTWVDPKIKGHASNNQKEIVETMNLALHCTAGDPTARPYARDLAKTLDSIMRSSFCVLGLKFSSII